jgi:WD40-like Beta Propeller Repeat
VISWIVLVRLAIVVVVGWLAVGCRQVFGIEDPQLAASSDARSRDGADAPGSITCLQAWHMGTIRFSLPKLIVEISGTTIDRDPNISPDELGIYFSSDRASSLGSVDEWVASRSSLTNPWGTPIRDGTFGTTSADLKITFSDDDLDCVLSSDRFGTQGGADLWEAQRSGTTTSWGQLVQTDLVLLNTVMDELDPSLSADGLRLYFSQTKISGQTIEVASRASRADAFGAPESVLPISAGTTADADPDPSYDETLLLFTSIRAGGIGGSDIWYATRPGTSANFSTPVLVPDINGAATDGDPSLSRDGCRLYFSSDRAGTFDIYLATAAPTS